MSDTQKSEIEAMISGYPAEEEIESEEKSEEEEHDEEFEEDFEEGEEGREEEAIEEDEDDSDSDTSEEEEKEEDEQDETESLREQLNAMSRRLKEAGLSIESGRSEESDDDEEEEESSPELSEFITAEELEELQEKPETLNTILNRVYLRARTDTLKSIPDVVKQTTARQITLQNKVREFYEENSDLLPHRDFVGFIASEIENENSDKDLDWIFKEASKESRKRLGLKHLAKSTEEKRKRKDKKPAFASKSKGGRGHKKHDTRNKEQKQIDAMIDL